MATLGLNPAEYPSEVRPQDDGMKYHDGPHQGMEFDSRDRPWAAQQGGGYWQEQWRPDGGEYGFGGQGTGGSDWTSGWQMPMAMNDGWQRNRNGATKSKRRFCTSYPDVSQCRRGAGCAFAHSREEIGVPLLSVAEENQEPHALTDDFFMYKYKMSWCPIGVQHEWHTCVYAHNYQDARRPPTIGYGARLCPYWSKKDTGAEYSQRCPLGLRCPYSHGAKEQLYHPHYFKTVVCRDLRGKACPRHKLCAFYHHRHERRTTPVDDVDYEKPLPVEALPESWVTDFLSPPFHAESSKPRMDDPKERNMMQAPGQMEQGGQYGQMMQAPGQMEQGGQYGQMHCGQMPFFPMLMLPQNVVIAVQIVETLPGQMPSGERELENSPAEDCELSPCASPRCGTRGFSSSDNMLPWACPMVPIALPIETSDTPEMQGQCALQMCSERCSF